MIPPWRFGDRVYDPGASRTGTVHANLLSAGRVWLTHVRWDNGASCMILAHLIQPEGDRG